VHCARLPDYLGLNAIGRALKNKDYDQAATLHKVIRQIDAGKIIAKKSYKLNPELSYKENEAIAYNSGIQLLIDFISKNNNFKKTKKRIFP
jgi:methionyl-tRNA formyltransferase